MASFAAIYALKALTIFFFAVWGASAALVNVGRRDDQNDEIARDQKKIVALEPRVPSKQVCDEQYFFVSKLSPLVCQSKPPAAADDREFMIQFQAPSQTWKEIPSIIQMEYTAPGNDTFFHATGPFQVTVLVSTVNHKRFPQGHSGYVNEMVQAGGAVIMDGQTMPQIWGQALWL